jgi:hypothetical protein
VQHRTAEIAAQANVRPESGHPARNSPWAAKLLVDDRHLASAARRSTAFNSQRTPFLDEI